MMRSFGLSVAFSIMIAAGYWLFRVEPALATLSTERDQRAEMHRELRLARAVQRFRRQFLQERQLLCDSLDQFRQFLPGSTAAASDRLRRVISERGFQLVDLKSDDPRRREEVPFLELPMELEVYGTFEACFSLARFIEEGGIHGFVQQAHINRESDGFAKARFQIMSYVAELNDEVCRPGP